MSPSFLPWFNIIITQPFIPRIANDLCIPRKTHGLKSPSVNTIMKGVYIPHHQKWLIIPHVVTSNASCSKDGSTWERRTCSCKSKNENRKRVPEKRRKMDVQRQDGIKGERSTGKTVDTTNEKLQCALYIQTPIMYLSFTAMLGSYYAHCCTTETTNPTKHAMQPRLQFVRSP